MDKPVRPSVIEGQVIVGGKSYQINACGPINSVVGTEGSFELVDEESGRQICHVYWDCPFDTSNTWKISGKQCFFTF